MSISHFRETRSDGDIDLGNIDYSKFVVPDCSHCGGLLKPTVVFFGENVASDTVTSAMDVVGKVFLFFFFFSLISYLLILL